MSSILDRPAVRDVALPLSVRQYQRLGATGMISAQTELLRGVILRKTIKSPQHTWLVQKLGSVISAPSSGKYSRCQTLGFEAAIVCGALPTIRVDLPQLK